MPFLLQFPNFATKAHSATDPKLMAKKKERVAIYLDGSNFYFKMRSRPMNFDNLTKFDYRGMAAWLSQKREMLSCRYYVGVVRAEEKNQKGQELRKEQQKLFSHLLSQKQNFTIKKGYIMEHDGVYHEKGVDVQLAIDLLIGAYEDYYDTAIVISSDTDLMPAIKKIRSLGKKIEYIGFAHQPSIALKNCATVYRLLTKQELEKFTVKETAAKKQKHFNKKFIKKTSHRPQAFSKKKITRG